MRLSKPSRSLIAELLLKVCDLLGLFTAMFLSEILVMNPLFGGAVYIMCEVWVLYVRIYNRKGLLLLPMHIRVRGLVLFILAALLTVALFIVFPYMQSSLESLLLALLIIGFLAQQLITDTLARRLSAKKASRRMLPLALCHALFLFGYWLLFTLLSASAPPETAAAYLAAVGISALLLACQVAEPLNEPYEDAGDAAPLGDRLLTVRAYRLYNRMTVNTLVALNLSITAFICYMRFLPRMGLLGGIGMLLIWIAFIALVTVAGFALLRRRFLPKYDRYAIFFMGIVLWAIALFRMLSGRWQGTLLDGFINGGLMGLSMACMLSIILLQSYLMQEVISLGLGPTDQAAYRRNTRVMVDWSMLTSYLLLLVMLCVPVFAADAHFRQGIAAPWVDYILRVLVLALPMLFVLVALIYSLLQPLDKQYAEKLTKFTKQKAEGQENAPLENRLKKVLVGNYPRRLAIILLRPLARPFFPCKVVGAENVRAGEGPMVFLCNHLEVYGPVISILYSPFPLRPWVIHGMLDKDILIEQTRSGAQKLCPLLPLPLRTAIVKILTPLVIWILNATDPIPVYRDSLRDTIKTIEASVDAMAYDDNILIFPETDYKAEGVGTLFAGFVQLGRSYYRRTGRAATFYPMYVNRKAHRMSFGEGITFDPRSETGVERDRLVTYLQTAMQDMADAPPPPKSAKGRKKKSDEKTTVRIDQ